MVLNLRQLVKKSLGNLPDNDYPVMNSFLFVSCWLNFALDSSVLSMRGLFYQLNLQGVKVDISTFSKATKKRDIKVFETLFNSLRNKLNSKKHNSKQLTIFPLDSTTIILTSKLLWSQNIHQVKLFAGLNMLNHEPGGVVINFGQGHDSKYGNETIEATPENGVAVMDRGFASLDRIKELSLETKRFFVLRIKNNYTLEMLENGNFNIGKKKNVQVRVVAFCDLERKAEYLLATNLPLTDNKLIKGVSNEEIGEIYRQRWQIELLWKFLWA